MTVMSPTISVIIVSHNVCDLLRECLDSVSASGAAPPVDVIVVDNASDDATVEMLRSQYLGVRLLANHANVGFARANNQGLTVATDTPYVMLLNPDTVVRPGAVEALCQAMEADPALGIVGPRIVNPDGSLQSGPLAFPGLVSTAFGMAPARQRRAASATHGVVGADWVLGACMLVRRAVINTVGPMDDGYFLYGEEKDWCYRVKQAGWRVGVLMDAEVVHHGGGSTSQRAPMSYQAYIDSQVRFFHKFYPRRYRTAFLASVLAQASTRCAAAQLLTCLDQRRKASWQARRATHGVGARRAWEHLTGRVASDAR